MNEKRGPMNYEEFLRENRIHVNTHLNRILWVCIFAGPAIAIGIWAGAFPEVDYLTCLIISLVVAALAGVHTLLKKWKPDSAAVSLFALVGLEGLIFYMTLAHVGVHLTWFFVPILGIMLCDFKVYLFTILSNFGMMALAAWLTAPYFASVRADYDTPLSYFLNYIGGLVIETIIMGLAGYRLGRNLIGYFRNIFRQYHQIEEHEKKQLEQMAILDSMAEIYDNVNLLDFEKMTEMSLREEELISHSLDFNKHTHTIMNHRIKKHVVSDHLERFQIFTNITTVQNRLRGKKLISGEFISMTTGWFRAQYITCAEDEDGTPRIVIYTTQNIDEEKRREEHLIRISMTDELTRLYNRRCYEEDLNMIRDRGMEDDFVLYSIDVNGLKKVNDTMGHAAGDEMIKGAADCLSFAVGAIGKAYRTGGDEFFVIAHTQDPEGTLREIRDKSAEWHGSMVEKISMSIGFATHHEAEQASIDDLEHMADKRMYEDKDRYYKESGIDRRK